MTTFKEKNLFDIKDYEEPESGELIFAGGFRLFSFVFLLLLIRALRTSRFDENVVSVLISPIPPPFFSPSSFGVIPRIGSSWSMTGRSGKTSAWDGVDERNLWSFHRLKPMVGHQKLETRTHTNDC
jgi:hypothetical protein